MDDLLKFKYKYDNFTKAIKWLNESNVAYKRNSENDIYQDALIKRFEFTFELAWKTLREFLTEQGYKLEILSPKGVFKFAYSEGILSNETIWLEMLEARNSTAHDYGRELSAEVADKISVKFCKELNNLYKYLCDKNV